MSKDYCALKDKAWAFLEEVEGADDDSLVKSKDRVAEHGEVFTPRWCVRDMLNLEGVMENSFDLDKTFLEPSCGTGNFLIQILIRKLCMCNTDAEKIDLDVVRAVRSIYGVDIMEDNIKTSRERMLSAIKHLYETSGNELSANTEKSIQYIMNRNIVLGNTLTGEKIKEVTSSDSAEKSGRRSMRKKLSLSDERTDASLTVSEWIVEDNGMITRKESYFTQCGTDDCCSVDYDPVMYTELYKTTDKAMNDTAGMI